MHHTTAHGLCTHQDRAPQQVGHRGTGAPNAVEGILAALFHNPRLQRGDILHLQTRSKLAVKSQAGPRRRCYQKDNGWNFMPMGKGRWVGPERTPELSLTPCGGWLRSGARPCADLFALLAAVLEGARARMLEGRAGGRGRAHFFLGILRKRSLATPATRSAFH